LGGEKKEKGNGEERRIIPLIVKIVARERGGIKGNGGKVSSLDPTFVPRGIGEKNECKEEGEKRGRKGKERSVGGHDGSNTKEDLVREKGENQKEGEKERKSRGYLEEGSFLNENYRTGDSVEGRKDWVTTPIFKLGTSHVDKNLLCPSQREPRGEVTKDKGKENNYKSNNTN